MFEHLEKRFLRASPELDLTFGEGGVAPIPNSYGDGFYVLRTLSSGKIVGVGSATYGEPVLGQDDPLVARFNPDGTPDKTFDKDGILFLAEPDGVFGSSRGAAVAADGKIYLNYEEENGNFRIYRFNANGTVDTSFGTNGIVKHTLARLAALDSITVQKDGKVLMGISIDVSPDERINYLVRFNADGSVDNGFRGGLAQPTPLLFVAGQVQAAPDGKIYVANDINITRLNPDGTTDTSYGSDGIIRIYPRSKEGSLGFTKMALDSAGRLLVTSQFNVNPKQGISISRFTTSGAHDASFGGGDGFTQLAMGLDGPTPTAPLVAPDGKITVGVSHWSTSRLQLYRVNPDGTKDLAFGEGGKVESQRQLFQPRVLAFDKKKNILVGGAYSEVAVARFAQTSPTVALSSSGLLTVTGSDDADSITIRRSSADAIVAERNGKLFTFASKDVKRIAVHPSAGGDVITVGFTISCTVGGGTGNDTIALAGGDATIEGGAGNDRITCGNGNHDIKPGSGSDRIITGSGKDHIYKDFISGVGNDTIVTGAGDDTILTGAGNDLITCGSGNDAIYTNDGNDTVNAGAGNDIIGDDPEASPSSEIPNHSVGTFKGKKFYIGGEGNDSITGSSEADTIWGNGGRDTIYANAGSDSINGGGGNDYIESRDLTEYHPPSGADRNTVSGGDGDDTLNGDYGDDTFYGDAGNDRIDDSSGNNVFHGGSGNDFITGGADSDTLYGDDGNDRLVGNLGKDVVYGGKGNDRLAARDESVDRLFGEDGRDTVDADANDVLSSIEVRQ
ncbi:MAG TPA: hypothetical protein VF669_03765 [Tepidisphaeraceae bacterium]|jgi:uncharacterized delta-60 repeat protein